MKLLIAVIQPTKLHAVREALEKLEVARMTICDAQSFGHSSADASTRWDPEHVPKLQRKVVLEVVVNNDFLQRTVDTIIHVARTGPEGTFGDGKIFVLPAEEAIQLSDAARGPGSV